jgi:hypothetical protein
VLQQVINGHQVGPKLACKLNDGQRRELVRVVRKILSYGELSKFEYEAFCRHSVRISLILESSWSWLAADLTAAEIVNRALRQIGAKRPRWIDGQDWSTRLPGGRVYCANESCRKVIGQTSLRAVMYCCEGCRTRAKAKRTYRDHAEDYAASARARRAAARAQGEVRNCEFCGCEFRPLDDSRRKQRFCGKTCRSRYASSCNAAWRPFRLPSQRDRQGRFRRAT